MRESTGGAGNPAAAVGFELLGPLTIVCDDRRVLVRAPRQQLVLATLLLETNHVVGMDRLIDTLWEENPPVTARSQVHICVSAVRRILADLGAGELVSTAPQGYLARVSDDRIDVKVFEGLSARARQLAEDGALEEAARILRRATGMWRGNALDGLRSSRIKARATRLDENRLAALEDCAEWELQLGRHQQLISELSERVTEHPLRERTRQQLMLALHRSGRQAEALDVYRDGRRELVEQLGLEPGEDLRRLEALILADDPELRLSGEDGVPPGHPVPRQLPADIPDFTGRAATSRQVYQALAGEHRGERNAMPVAELTGPGGVGKSTLAVHVAHRLAGDIFVDGQLYADLHGGLARPRDPMDVLRGFLRALDVTDAEIPESIEDRAALYRSRVADRRILLLLEDAASAEQVAPLLPGSPACAVLVTSRMSLTRLSGAHFFEVRPLPVQEGVELLCRIVHDGRAEAERPAAAELTRLVGGLPLALRIIGSRLVSRPHWTLESMVDRLADERRRLDELTHGQVAVRATISLTDNNLSPVQRRLLRLLCTLDADDFPAWIAAAVLDVDVPRATDLMEELVDAQLLQATTVAGRSGVRYRPHELVRVFARERADEDPPSLRLDALARVCGGWLALTERAHQSLYGGQFTVMHGYGPRWTPADGFPEPGDPLDWLEYERANLCAAVRQCAAADLDELSWDLASTLVTLFEARSHLTDWEDTHIDALAATRRAGNRRGSAVMLCSLGSLHLSARRLAEARSLLDQAIVLFTTMDEPLGRALTLRNLAMVDQLDGELGQAKANYEAALEQFRAANDPIGAAHVLIGMAHVDIERGRLGTVVGTLEQAQVICRSAGITRLEAQALRGLGAALLAHGQAMEAARVLAGALELTRAQQDSVGEMRALRELARVHVFQRGHADAMFCLRQALEVSRQVPEPTAAAGLRMDLAQVLAATGDVTEAVEQVRAAVLIYRKHSMERAEDEARTLLSSLERRLFDAVLDSPALDSSALNSSIR